MKTKSNQDFRVILLTSIFSIVWFTFSVRAIDSTNLIANPGFEERTGNAPTGFVLTGAAQYRFLGDPKRDAATYGIGLASDQPSGAVSCIVSNLDAHAGKWFRFSFRGLPQANFAVNSNNLYLKIEFFGQDGKISYDAKEKRIYDQVQQFRRDMTTNGVRHQHGAEVWRTYMVDFSLPFPQVDQLKLSIGFGNGMADGPTGAQFLVDELSLIGIPAPSETSAASPRPTAIVPSGNLLPLAGRWFYAAQVGETNIPKSFNTSNADRLLYHDDAYSAPFAGNTSAWLRAGDLDANGIIVTKDRLIEDNVTIQFTADTMIIHTHGIPNHPTGRFPELGFGNPNYITETVRTFYFPLTPKENPRHVALIGVNNSNHALPMGPIGLAVNGVVFFNPFDANSQDASDLMDFCCGHPAPDGEYHYHKYPICVNSPWADDGTAHSPLLGWAFDGYPLYGPYETADSMAKDIAGEHALNEFNMHYDEDRGWHYHVTPGKFPYLIGGYWGTEDAKDGGERGRRGGPGSGGPRGPGFGRPPRGPRGFDRSPDSPPPNFQ
jgi:YHYH protein